MSGAAAVDSKYFLMLVALLVMGWFAVGIIYNLRSGDKILRWMQAGLPKIGEKTTVRWLGSSVAELVIAKAIPPFRRMETLVVLAPRDVPWLWVLSAARGRRDTLIFRAHLASAPKLDFELLDPSAWTGRTALEKAKQRGWESTPNNGHTLVAPHGTLEQAASNLERLQPELQALGLHASRFSLRRDAPHLELHLAFPNTRQADAAVFFRALQKIAISAGEAHPSTSQ